MNQLCKVCSEPAAGYHFGAFTCEGCKSFFGRTYNNLGALGECKNNGQCVINKKNRTSCKSCRLKKCLVVGMSKSGSRYGRRSNWFKIHCLIQDQAEMSKNRTPAGMTEDGMTRDANDHSDRSSPRSSSDSPPPPAVAPNVHQTHIPSSKSPSPKDLHRVSRDDSRHHKADRKSHNNNHTNSGNSNSSSNNHHHQSNPTSGRDHHHPVHPDLRHAAAAGGFSPSQFYAQASKALGFNPMSGLNPFHPANIPLSPVSPLSSPVHNHSNASSLAAASRYFFNPSAHLPTGMLMAATGANGPGSPSLNSTGSSVSIGSTGSPSSHNSNNNNNHHHHHNSSGGSGKNQADAATTAAAAAAAASAALFKGMVNGFGLNPKLYQSDLVASYAHLLQQQQQLQQEQQQKHYQAAKGHHHHHHQQQQHHHRTRDSSGSSVQSSASNNNSSHRKSSGSPSLSSSSTASSNSPPSASSKELLAAAAAAAAFNPFSHLILHPSSHHQLSSLHHPADSLMSVAAAAAASGKMATDLPEQEKPIDLSIKIEEDAEDARTRSCSPADSIESDIEVSSY